MVTQDETACPWLLSTCHCRLRVIPSSSFSATEGTLWIGAFDNANSISTVRPISAGHTALLGQSDAHLFCCPADVLGSSVVLCGLGNLVVADSTKC